MHFVDKMRSSPAADEEDGRKAPGPKKADDTIVVSTRVETAVAEALGAIAKADGQRISAALREAGFTDRDIWDIAAVASFFNMSNRMASAVDMRPNEAYHAQAR